jgi:aspartyl-tRNA(Asn)/glutamyl-tRNA(Gln) amidotransferase subunit C
MSAPEPFDLNYVAQLARLSLSAEEKVLFQKQLGDVLSYIDKLKEVDVSEVDLEAEPSSMANVFRDDVPCDWFTTAEALANAPRQANNLFIVPKVIE